MRNILVSSVAFLFLLGLAWLPYHFTRYGLSFSEWVLYVFAFTTLLRRKK